MAKSASTAKGKVTTEDSVQQMFKVDPLTYRKVRLLAATRSGSGRPATGQDIYKQAVKEYLERNAEELESVPSQGE